ncbi:WD1261 family protein [Wolbachia endosymbiont of Folsomia candida]|uniref:WD1261 family protein n=1 Tax=Wolbachia endosymbiont of Folsomia candida TaxID=169402 RepID=UPI000AB491D3|nr:hypothetical protein [Wolbachia endosymbiont of Folsomia candida]APR98374.1 hypothetical protein ASM33_03730 [Wolbachia endosymbiont of Folsomia candida]
MIKEVEELIKIVGKGNLLEAVFIRCGSFQHADLGRHIIDHRNHLDLSSFIRKAEEPLDRYFNLMFSLQGLFLIHTQAYKILAENDQLSTQEVIDKIYAAVSNNMLGQQLNEIINHEQPTEDEKKFKLLNILANPKGNTLFNNESDFEEQVLKSVKGLLKINYADKFDKEFSLCKEVISHYYSIHNIKTDKDIALLFSSYGIFSVHRSHQDILPLNQYINEKAQKINTSACYNYIIQLTQVIRQIELPHQNGFTTYRLDNKGIGDLTREFNTSAIYANEGNQGFSHPKSIKSTLKKLLKNQNSDGFSDEFEKRVTDPQNIYYQNPHQEHKEEKNTKYKNTACWVILGAATLSLVVCIVDYLFMKQKLLQPFKGILPQDNFTNLAIAALLTIIIVYAVFQLLNSQQKPPELPSSMVNEINEVASGSVVNTTHYVN